MLYNLWLTVGTFFTYVARQTMNKNKSETAGCVASSLSFSSPSEGCERVKARGG